jgi:predicted Ser/Thr protein kinase
MTTNPESLIGQTLNDYTIIRKIGGGGMGIVYEAEQRSLRRTVALKLLHPRYNSDQENIQRFHQEAQNAARLDHPNIVKIFEVNQANGYHYIAMQYIDGMTLEAWSKQNGPVPLEQIVPLLASVADALDHAHGLGIVHRDIKPSNILLHPKGQTWVPYLVDFGIARLLNSGQTLTQPGSVIGTPDYMSPEQARGLAVSKQSDIYAVGVLVYELLTSQLPFDGSTPTERLFARLQKPPAPISMQHRQVAAPVEQAVMRALEVDPASRYASTSEFIITLQNLLPTNAVAASTTVMVTPAPRPQPRVNSALVRGIGAALLLIGLIFAGSAVWHQFSTAQAVTPLPSVIAELPTASVAADAPTGLSAPDPATAPTQDLQATRIAQEYAATEITLRVTEMAIQNAATEQAMNVTRIAEQAMEQTAAAIAVQSTRTAAEAIQGTTTAVAVAEANRRIQPPPVISRQNWQAAAAAYNGQTHTPSSIVLSHDNQMMAAGEDAHAKIRSMQGYHQRLWSDIAWHYIVDLDGNIYEGRDINIPGDTSFGFNTSGIIAIGLLGDYDSQHLNQNQHDALVNLMAWLCQEYDIAPAAIYPHRHFAEVDPNNRKPNTSPGSNIDINNLSNAVAARIATGR